MGNIVFNNIRYALLRRRTWGDFFSSHSSSSYLGCDINSANFFRSLQDAIDSLEYDSGVMIQFVVNNEDSIIKLTQRYETTGNYRSRKIGDDQHAPYVIQTLDTAYQRYLDAYRFIELRTSDPTPPPQDLSNKHYCFARLSDGIGADYDNFSITMAMGDAAGYFYGLLFPIAIPLSLSLKICFLAQLGYHLCSDEKMLGCSTEKPILFSPAPYDEEGLPLIANTSPGVWVKFEIDQDAHFVKLTAAYYINVSWTADSQQRTLTELSGVEDISDKAIAYFHAQYSGWLTENKEQKETEELNRTQTQGTMVEAAKITYQKQLRKAEGDRRALGLPSEPDARPSAPAMGM